MKVITKFSYKSVKFDSSVKSKNISHIKYISERSGVDKSLTEKDKELMSSNNKYMDYIDKRPKSQGLFGEKLEDRLKVQKEIQKKELSWRMIVSVRESDIAITKDEFQEIIRKQMPKVADQMGIDRSNFRWVGAFHNEKGHPHVHVVMWQKHEEIKKGKLKQEAINEVKKNFTKEIFENEFNQILRDRNNARDDLLFLVKDKMKEFKLGNIHAPRLDSKIEKELANDMTSLARKLPQRGRITYKLMPTEIKAEVNKITDKMLENNLFKAKKEIYLKAVEQNVLLYNSNEKNMKEKLDNATKDLKKRLNNIVLTNLKEMNQLENYQVDFKKLKNLNRAVDRSMTKNNNLSEKNKEFALKLKNIEKEIKENTYENINLISASKVSNLKKELGLKSDKHEDFLYKSKNPYNPILSTVDKVWSSAFKGIVEMEREQSLEKEINRRIKKRKREKVKSLYKKGELER